MNPETREHITQVLLAKFDQIAGVDLDTLSWQQVQEQIQLLIDLSRTIHDLNRPPRKPGHPPVSHV